MQHLERNVIVLQLYVLDAWVAQFVEQVPLWRGLFLDAEVQDLNPAVFLFYFFKDIFLSLLTFETFRLEMKGYDNWLKYFAWEDLQNESHDERVHTDLKMYYKLQSCYFPPDSHPSV